MCHRLLDDFVAGSERSSRESLLIEKYSHRFDRGWVDSSSQSEPSAIVEGDPGHRARKVVEKLVAEAEVESSHLRNPLLSIRCHGIRRFSIGCSRSVRRRCREDRRVGESTQVDDCPPGIARSEHNPVGEWRDRRSLATGGEVCAAKIADNIASHFLRDHGWVDQLERDGGLVIKRLAMNCHKIWIAMTSREFSERGQVRESEIPRHRCKLADCQRELSLRVAESPCQLSQRCARLSDQRRADVESASSDPDRGNVDGIDARSGHRTEYQPCLGRPRHRGQYRSC